MTTMLKQLNLINKIRNKKIYYIYPNNEYDSSDE